MAISGVTLTGTRVRLEPLRRDHAHGLMLAADEATFEHMPLRPKHRDLGGFLLYAERLIDAEGIVPFAVIDLVTGRVAGSTAFYGIRPEHRGISVGYTWLGPGFRGTPINPEMKLLMLAQVFDGEPFDTGPAIRVQLKTDARNERSQRAMERLGFVREGVLRSHMILPDGRIRDSVVYSVIQHEWPGVRGRLTDRITELGAREGAG